MRAVFFFVIGIVLILNNSCRNDFSTSENHGLLQFSKDTVFLDTVFTNISSSTYGLKVYNKSNQRINIPSIHLGRKESSFYRLSVDGIPGKQFQNIAMEANDSIYIFIEATIDYEAIQNPLYIDSLVFDNGIKNSNVKLVTLVKDAHLLFQSETSQVTTLILPEGFHGSTQPIDIQGFYINDINDFTNEKPYVIYGYGIIPENNTVSIASGAEFYFHENSGLIFSKNTSINLNGNINNKVVFQGDRLEPEYADLPGQWSGLWFQEGISSANLENVIIKNASIGLFIDAPSSSEVDYKLENIEIYNCSDFGLIGRNTRLSGQNMVINNCGKSSLALINGGKYAFLHSTFTNYWNQSIRITPTVYISNYNYLSGDANPNTFDLVLADFKNCILEGSRLTELELDFKEGSSNNYNFENSLIRFNDNSDAYINNPSYDFSNETHFKGIFLNLEADFKDPLKNELFIGLNSALIGKGNNNTTLLVPIDLIGTMRTFPADLGAYQHIDFTN